MKRREKKGYHVINLKIRFTLSVALIFILAASSLGQTYSVFADSGNVHGTIVDEDGGPLRDVKVLAYLNSGGLAETEYTNSDGYFRLALEAGSYTLQFEKAGYVTGEESISLSAGWVNDPDNDPAQFGKIVLQNAIQLKTSILSRVAGPGETISIEFTLSNAGDESEEIEFSVDAPEDWDTRVLSSENEIKKVLLDSGFLSLELEATISSTFDEQATITLTALGTLNIALVFTIFPEAPAHPEIELVSTYLSVSEELGKTIYIPLTVENEGETDEIIELEADVPSGWSIKFITGSEMVVNSLYLVSRDSEALSVKISPSEEAAIGDYYVDVRAKSEDGVLRDSLRLKVNLRAATSDVEIISTFTDVTAEAGDTINFPLAIWNRGETDILFLLSVISAPDKWKTVFTLEDIKVSSILVTASESRTLQLEVTPPSTVAAGAYPIMVYSKSDDGLISKQIDIEVNIVGSYEIDLELSTLYTTMTIGNSVQLSVGVTNWGYSPVTMVYLDTKVPENWQVTTSPTHISTVYPKETAHYTITMETPEDTLTGDYLITVQALSDQAESEEANIRVTAKASTSWGFIGIGLVTAVVLAMVFVFLKFKRR